jgi:TP901-1 family phage major tail protein
MNCNTTQKETGGKDMLLKICKDIVVDITPGTGSTSNLVSEDHALKVGDIVAFDEIGTLTEVTVGSYYFVKEVVDTDTFKIAVAPGSAAISFTHGLVDGAVEAFEAIGGIRTKSKAFTSDGIEVTNEDSDQWKVLLDGAGIRSYTFSGDGVYNNGLAYQRMETRARANQLTCFMLVDTKNLKLTVGCFKITSLEEAGGHDAEGTFSMSAESSGEVTVEQLGN